MFNSRRVLSANTKGTPFWGAFCIGGGCGIRTHVGLLPNGFQDRLVMTTSITLRVFKYYNRFLNACQGRKN